MSRTPGIWELARGENPVRVPVRGRLVLNDSIAIRDALLAGQGVALIPSFYVGEELRKRKLRAFLDEHTQTPLYVYATYHRSRHLSPKVRLFVEFLRENFAKADWR